MNSASSQPVRTQALLCARVLQWARGPTFGRDIVLILAFKLVLLMALKYAFFNHPQAENMSMPPAAVAQAILSVPVPPVARPPVANPPQGEQHHAD